MPQQAFGHPDDDRGGPETGRQPAGSMHCGSDWVMPATKESLHFFWGILVRSNRRVELRKVSPDHQPF